MKPKRPEPLFRKGDRVRVNNTCIMTEHVGREFTVRRVFWDDGGQHQGTCWVCEVDERMTPGNNETLWRCFWESLLEKSTPENKETI